jgi:hypothetical protein
MFVTEKDLLLFRNPLLLLGVTSFFDVTVAWSGRSHLLTQEITLFIVDDRRNYKEIGLESGTLSWCCLCECVISFGLREVSQTVVLGPHPRRFSCHFFIILSGVRLSPLGTVATTDLLYQPQMIDDGDCGAISGMKTGRGNRSTRRTPAPMPLCPPQISHDLFRARTLAAALWSQRLTAWAMARSSCEWVYLSCQDVDYTECPRRKSRYSGRS